MGNDAQILGWLMAGFPHLFLIDLSPTWSMALAQTVALHHQADPSLTMEEITRRIFVAGIISTLEAHDRRAPIVVGEAG